MNLLAVEVESGFTLSTVITIIVSILGILLPILPWMIKISSRAGEIVIELKHLTDSVEGQRTEITRLGDKQHLHSEQLNLLEHKIKENNLRLKKHSFRLDVLEGRRHEVSPSDSGIDDE